MHILMLTNEYPPNVYGGAGVHVQHLSRALLHLEDESLRLTVYCFGTQQEDSPRKTVRGIEAGAHLFRGLDHGKFLDVLFRNLVMAGMPAPVDLIHCHTWYSYLAGCLLRSMLPAPLVLTLHSLEPQRPWKKEQLGAAYHAASWLEKTALHKADGIIAVSAAMRKDVQDLYPSAADKVEVVYNGIDTGVFRPREGHGIRKRYGIDPQRPFALFVGRITQQKGLIHLINALPLMEKDVQLVLCTGTPDTKTIGRQIQECIAAVRQQTENDLIWHRGTVPVDDLAALYSRAAVFVCPSIYEPFGIINLEAMACGTPVVAAAVGGIPEVVRHQETGILVPFEAAADAEPKDPQRYAAALADAVNTLLKDPKKRRRMGAAAKQRVEEKFSWSRVAQRTALYYRRLTGAKTA